MTHGKHTYIHTHACTHTQQNEVPLMKKRKGRSTETSFEQEVLVNFKLLGSEAPNKDWILLFVSLSLFFQDSKVPWTHLSDVRSLSPGPIYNHVPWHIHSTKGKSFSCLVVLSPLCCGQQNSPFPQHLLNIFHLPLGLNSNLKIPWRPPTPRPRGPLAASD